MRYLAATHRPAREVQLCWSQAAWSGQQPWRRHPATADSPAQDDDALRISEQSALSAVVAARALARIGAMQQEIDQLRTALQACLLFTF